MLERSESTPPDSVAPMLSQKSRAEPAAQNTVCTALARTGASELQCKDDEKHLFAKVAPNKDEADV